MHALLAGMRSRSERARLRSCTAHRPLRIARQQRDLLHPTVRPAGQVPAKVIDENGKTPLHYAAFAGRIGVARLLLDADPSALAIVSPVDGYTPLLDALVSEHAEVSALLIKSSHADLTATDINGHSVLFHAARFQTASLVRAVLKTKELSVADVNAAGKRTKFTALHAASLEGQDESVELLLAAGANVHARDMEASMPLHLVAQREVGGARVVELLVRAGANVSARMETENSKSVTALHLAANKGNIGVVEALLEAGASLHAKDKIGRTPLVAAIAKGTAAMVALLLKRGASAKEFRSAFNFTALHFAAGQGKQDIVDVLVGPGEMEIDAVDNRISRATALHYAAGEVWLCLPCSDLIREGTPFVAAGKGNVKGVKALLRHKPNLSKRDGYNVTALHYAAQSGSAALVRALLQAGADLTIKGPRGFTPMDFAA